MTDVPENAPNHCPGTDSKDAGKVSACEGCPNQSICASSVPKPPDPDIDVIRDRLATVKHKILILSGKGGVGKTTVTSHLAYGLAKDESVQVGVLDIDICGPSVPVVMGLAGEQVHNSGSGWSPVYVQDNLAVMSAGFLLASPKDAVIWRGPKKNGLIKQFLRDVDWDVMDFLLVDTPPGTSDEHLSVVQYLKKAKVDGAVIVTTPQEVALNDVRKEINFCRKVDVPIIGVVENMSWFVCPNCSKTSEIFPPTSGGAEAMAKAMNVQLLGKVPLDPRLARCCDEGKSFLDELPDSPATKAYLHLVDNIKKYCKEQL